jgi:putative transport protein
VVEVLGQPCEEVNYTLDLERQRRRVVATSKELIGRSLEKLHLLSRFGVTISRITRQDVEFVPSPQDRILHGDALSVVGEPEALDRFVAFAGHRERTLDETDLMSLALGLLLGVLAGQIEVTLAGRTVSLGLAGGPLLVGLLLGHWGQIGPLVGRIPRAGRLLLGEIGLAMFLAQAGASAGATIVPVLAEHGVSLCLAAIVLVVVPLMTGLVTARYLLRISTLEMCGAICGAMTSTPGLGAATANVESSLPAISYATVYPVALILITLTAPLLLTLIS